MALEKYTDQQFSRLVIQLIFKIYDNPERILETFRGNIRREFQYQTKKKDYK